MNENIHFIVMEYLRMLKKMLHSLKVYEKK